MYTTAAATAASATEQEAAFIFGAEDVRLGVLPVPTAEEGVTALLNVEMVGICGSDLHYYKDGGIGSDKISAPFVSPLAQQSARTHTVRRPNWLSLF